MPPTSRTLTVCQILVSVTPPHDSRSIITIAYAVSTLECARIKPVQQRPPRDEELRIGSIEWPFSLFENFTEALNISIARLTFSARWVAQPTVLKIEIQALDSPHSFSVLQNKRTT